MAEWRLFDQVGEVVRATTPPELGRPHLRVHGGGLKVWFGGAEAPREHYEAQVVAAEVAGGRVLEIGFHAEHRREADNEAVLARLLAAEPRWRPVLGEETVAGAFLGAAAWRRVSETWADPDLEDREAVFEIGVRLVEYMTALEPLRGAADRAVSL
ncbi:hypothetical protein [Actinomadura parmotrematis]|uniref:Uncharacterized protein n=1 Tax=Actinomadura parmotrematis TaxID=2864039 RepID=A0ABS7G4V8_9ACTN|nr:hypothetical protein [Actinomadura parmotrematis]MBW8487723.1 hypothetical protein [Actinomadura parmotrematis]